MPKVQGLGSEGCLVTGLCYQADGQPRPGLVVRFTPARAGVWQGRAIGRTPVEVRTDEHGRFAIHLAPSSVFGRYDVALEQAHYVIEVPDAPAAEFAAIVRSVLPKR